jgi:hypothetical protein
MNASIVIVEDEGVVAASKAWRHGPIRHSTWWPSTSLIWC